jgi:hypothetical protein
VVVEVDDESFVFNVELNVDAYSAAFVGAYVLPSEDSAAVIETFEDARRTTGACPIALLLDNKPSNHISAVNETLASTLRIRSTSYRPQNKAHVEGAFGLLKPTIGGLTLTGGSPQQLAASFLRALVITAGRAINHRPRKNRGGRSRADLLTDTPSPEDIRRATEALKQRLHKQTLARQTRAARQDPIVRATLEDAYRRLGFDDPEGHQLTATARYPRDAVVEGIAIFESRKRADKLPAGVDARYLRGIIENIDGENDAWDLAMRCGMSVYGHGTTLPSSSTSSSSVWSAPPRVRRNASLPVRSTHSTSHVVSSPSSGSGPSPTSSGPHVPGRIGPSAPLNR